MSFSLVTTMRSYIQLDEVIDLRGLPRWLVIKNLSANAGDTRDAV